MKDETAVIPAEVEEMTVQVVDATYLELQTKAEIDVQISTAKAFPRSVKVSMDKALSIATINEEVAISCNYAVSRAGGKIEGPSVRLAEIVCSTFGNIRAGARVVNNDGKKVTAQGFCHDLETNNMVTVEVSRRITDSKGKRYSEDMQILTGNAAAAIAYRNAVFKVIPAALIESINGQIREVAKGKAETLVARRDKVVKWLEEKGVTKDRIAATLELKRIEDIDLDKLYTLQGIWASVKNGEVPLSEAFPAPGAESKGDTAAMADKVKAAAKSQTEKATPKDGDPSK